MQKFIDEELKNMTVLNERLSMASALHADKAGELDALADAIVESCLLYTSSKRLWMRLDSVWITGALLISSMISVKSATRAICFWMAIRTVFSKTSARIVCLVQAVLDLRE